MTGHVYAIGSEWVEIYWDSEGRCRKRVVERKYPPTTVKAEAKIYKHTRTRAQRRVAKRARRTRGKH